MCGSPFGGGVSGPPAPPRPAPSATRSLRLVFISHVILGDNDRTQNQWRAPNVYHLFNARRRRQEEDRETRGKRTARTIIGLLAVVSKSDRRMALTSALEPSSSPSSERDADEESESKSEMGAIPSGRSSAVPACGATRKDARRRRSDKD